MMHIYTDGSCLNNPGPGGYAIIIIPDPDYFGEPNHFKVEGGGAPNTTNNRMEMTAVTIGMNHAIQRQQSIYFDAFRAHPFRVTIFTDSSYVINGVEAVKKFLPEKNREFWKALDQTYKMGEFWKISWEFVKVEAHVGFYWNDLADAFARSFAEVQKELVEKSGDKIKVSLPGFS